MNDEGSLIRRIAMIIKGIAGYVIILALLIIVTYSVVNYSFRFGFTIFCAESVEEAPGTDVDVVVEKGETIDELAAKLYENGVIPSELAFRVQARLYDIGFYPGTYKVNTSMSTKEILKTIDMTEQEYADSLALQAAQEETENGIYGGGDEGTDLEAERLNNELHE
ncbi:MAG: endolytic transglycosylase MltG [Eubacteriales bacterium]|nr:endolytic transglycosylase MltG [Eubacteriales bacterium]